MPSTNKTTFANLSQYVNSDIISYIEDYNKDMGKIDAALSNYSDDKKYATIVVGHTSTGCAEKDVDFLCDGTNDWDQITEAMNAVPAGGGKVLLLNGTYICSLYVKSNVILEGCGVSTIIREKDGIGGTVFMEQNSTIRNLCVDGGRSVSYCIEIDGSDVTIDNCRIYDAMNGINVGYDKNVSNCKITNNIIKTRDRLGYGISIKGSNNILSHNTVNTKSEGGSGHGIYISGSNNTVSNNYCDENRHGIECIVSDSIIFNNICRNNTRAGSGYPGYGIYGEYENSSISNNFCYYNENGIWVENSNNTRIIGNTCIDSTDGGIVVYTSDGCVISNNVCKNNKNGIEIAGTESHIARDNIVTGNTCYRTDGYNEEQNTIWLHSVYWPWTDPGDYVENTVAANNIVKGKDITIDRGSHTIVNNVV